MKVLAFAATAHSKSINKKLVTYAVSLIEDAEVEILDLNDYELPLFTQDREGELGSPQLAQDFYAKIGGADALVISFAEHNGSYTAAYKNLFDWCSRIDQKVFQGKAMVLLSTSPGGRGGATVLKTATEAAPHFGGEVKATFSLPRFFDNFDAESKRIADEELNAELVKAVQALSSSA